MHLRLRQRVQHQVDWLLDGPVRLEDGMLAAWTEDRDPTYAYEESTGYLITLLCYLHSLTGDPRYEAEAARTVGALTHAVGSREGCGRDGVLYLFDTAVCLRALTCYFATFPDAEASRASSPTQSLARRLRRTAAAFTEQRLACEPCPPGGGAGRWSVLFGAHQLKALANLAQAAGAGPWAEPQHELLASWFEGGRFLTDNGRDRVYLHAHCYAAGGLLGLPGSPSGVVDQAAAYLARVQDPSGGIPRWWPAYPDGELAADATAQAARLWLLLDPARYAESISLGLGFLRRMCGTGGGVWYTSDRAHENGWATIFAVQARIWQDAAPDPAWLI